MDSRILAGIETEYGISIHGRDVRSQVEDAMAFVRMAPGVRHSLSWDYRQESPRADLRGFCLERLAQDPTDRQFDIGRELPSDSDVRSDQLLPNGARFYNDHGHPEYSTPECWSLDELVWRDIEGEEFLLRCANVYRERTGNEVAIYKNNSDGHGASYGTHENYLCPRNLGFDQLYQAVMPVLVARIIACGSGKVGAEHGKACDYQISQRADFFSAPFNAETLHNRPVFNTRDEPHADPAQWIRCHVIAGDACRIPAATRRKVGLVKLAIRLAVASQLSLPRIKDPVRAIELISKDQDYAFWIDLEGGSRTTAYDILDSVMGAAEALLTLDQEERSLIDETRSFLIDLRSGPENVRDRVDWAAKLSMIELYREADNLSWNNPHLKALDLEYHNLDPDQGVFDALRDEFGISFPTDGGPPERNRAWVRGLAVQNFPELVKASWSCLTFEIDSRKVEVYLGPERTYPEQLATIKDVKSFVDLLQEN